MSDLCMNDCVRMQMWYSGGRLCSRGSANGEVLWSRPRWVVCPRRVNEVRPFFIRGARPMSDLCMND